MAAGSMSEYEDYSDIIRNRTRRRSCRERRVYRCRTRWNVRFSYLYYWRRPDDISTYATIIPSHAYQKPKAQQRNVVVGLKRVITRARYQRLPPPNTFSRTVHPVENIRFCSITHVYGVFGFTNRARRTNYEFTSIIAVDCRWHLFDQIIIITRIIVSQYFFLFTQWPF